MKKCGYCGCENDDNAAHCRECGTEFAVAEVPQAKPPLKPMSEADDSEYHFAPLTEAQRNQDLVELVRCRTLMEAELLVSRLEAAGIWAFIPD